MEQKKQDLNIISGIIGGRQRKEMDMGGNRKNEKEKLRSMDAKSYVRDRESEMQ